jgi:ABC-type sugar transport system ATPase subunit
MERRGYFLAQEALLLKMDHIHKKFPGVYALNDAKLELRAGEVHALLGENGAGKSTLMKILGGIYEKNEGDIYIEGKKADIKSVEDARAAGISIIHQELVLVPYLTVAENIFLGREAQKNGFLDSRKMIQDTQAALDDFGLKLNPNSLIADLNIAQQQMVEIVKAISFNAKIIVMDEPTSSLSDTEVEGLFKSIRKLTARGIGIIYISHRMGELDEIADRVTVMRDGMYVDTKVVKETPGDELIRLMVGRELTNYYTRDYNSSKEIVLKVENLCGDNSDHVNFELHKGEILGFAGLIGAGRSETMETIFGLRKAVSGKVVLNGQEIQGLPTIEIMKKGIGLVPEDRRDEGIFPDMPTKFNVTLKVLDDFIRIIRVNGRKEAEIFDKCVNDLAVKVASGKTPIRNLSGGNQQKAILGSWLAANPSVLILDEPTRGVDVGAKSEIYTIMNNLAKEGVSIIMVSSDLPEVLNMSDRIAVMCNGAVTGILDHTEATQTKIMEKAVHY